MTNNTITLSDFLPTLLMALPLFIIWITGLILLISRWKNHPRVSLIGTIAFVLLIINGLIARAVNIVGPLFLSNGTMAVNQYTLLSGVTNILTGLVSAVIWVLLIITIFGWRNTGRTVPSP